MTADAGLDLGFRTLSSEVTGRDLPVEGSIPAWLDGALLRNGPAKFEAGGRRVDHWFDGLAMLHRFGFDGSGVTYTNRFLRTETYRAAVEDGELHSQFASGGGGYLARLRELLVGEPTDNANVHVARFDDEYVAMTETPRYVSFAPDTLHTQGEFRFADDLSGAINCAHVVPDPHRGETVGLLTDFGRRHAYRLYRVRAGHRRRELIADVPVEKPAYLHSFALSANYVVLTEHPFAVDPTSFLLPGGDGFADFFDWEPERGTRFVVVDRDSGAVVARRRAEALFVFHHGNAYEDDGDIVIDLATYPDDGIVGGQVLDEVGDWFRAGDSGRLRRYRVPVDGGPVRSETLADGLEFPRVARGDRTRRHRYVYAQGAASADGNHVLKVDAETGERRRWGESGLFLEEPVVVRAPDAPAGPDPASDRGVVLATGLNVPEERTDLLVLDAETLSERARAPLPHAVPFGFHGRYVPEL
jgi:carotenoid cleavage dioxygenase-like enzyme